MAGLKRLLTYALIWSSSVSWVFAAAAPQKVVITPASFSEREGILIVAQNQGFFRKHNVDVQLVLMPSAPVAFAALAAGESQFYFGTTSGAVEGYEFMRRMHTKRIYPTVDGIRNSLRMLSTTNEKFRGMKTKDLVDDRIVRKLEKEGAV